MACLESVLLLKAESIYQIVSTPGSGIYSEITLRGYEPGYV